MIIVIVYSVFLLLATIVWLAVKQPREIQSLEKVTAIVVVRNEAENIKTLISSLSSQTYANLEIIIVDDSSDDNTLSIIEEFKPKNLKVLTLSAEERGNSPKKAGVEKAIRLSEGSIIFSTDGDCNLPPRILETYVEYFNDPKTHFISGPVVFKKENAILNKIQTVEFSSLVGSAAVAIFLKNPIMSSASNMAYRKNTFLEVNGFDGNTNLASGDDEFLMNKIHQRHKNSINFAKNKDCVVETMASHSLNEFYQQRKRWAGKWSSSISWASKIVAVFIFLVNAYSIYYLLNGTWDVLLFRFLMEFLFLTFVLTFLNRKDAIVYIPLTQLLYPFYVVFFGLISIFPRKYKWKGRELQ